MTNTEGMQSSKSQLTKEKAAELGFDACGVVRLEPMNEDMLVLREWLDAGYNAEMGYMSNNMDKRANPALLVEGGKSAVVCIINYKQKSTSNHIASYALSKDYHFTLKKLLNELLDYIKEISPGATGRVFVDSAPIFERSFAVKAGLGWIGRNSMLINREFGSFVFIATLITDVELEYDIPYSENHCGGCSLCISACPTAAINDNKTIDANKCISYQTIEKRGEIPKDIISRSNGMIFGCDICQNVCPHNAKTKPTVNQIFSPVDNILEMSPEDWLQMGSGEFKRRFGSSPLSRCGIKKLKQTIESYFSEGDKLLF